MRNKSSQILVVLLLMFGVEGRFHDSAKEDRELLSSELEEVTFSRERRERATKDPNIVMCFYCEHTLKKRNRDCADPVFSTFLVLVQCNGTCVKTTWRLQEVTQYNRTCLANTPCVTEQKGEFYHHCCRFDGCNGTDVSRRSLTAILASVAFQVVRASRRFYLRFS